MTRNKRGAFAVFALLVGGHHVDRGGVFVGEADRGTVLVRPEEDLAGSDRRLRRQQLAACNNRFR